MDLVVALIFVVYFIPSVRAQYRDHARIGWIFALNLLVGWTGVGWILAFVLAGRPSAPPPEPIVLRRRGHLRLLGTSEAEPTEPSPSSELPSHRTGS